MKNSGHARPILLISLSLSLSTVAFSEAQELKLGLYNPLIITFTEGSHERTELGVVPCGKIHVAGFLEIVEKNRPIQANFTGLLTEFCMDPWGFRLDRAYVVEYQARVSSEYRIANVAEVILLSDDGVYVQEETWLLRAMPVTFESIPCSSIQIGPSPGMTDIDDERCIRFDSDEFLSEVATVQDSN